MGKSTLKLITSYIVYTRKKDETILLVPRCDVRIREYSCFYKLFHQNILAIFFVNAWFAVVWWRLQGKYIQEMRFLCCAKGNFHIRRTC